MVNVYDIVNPAFEDTIFRLVAIKQAIKITIMETVTKLKSIIIIIIIIIVFKYCYLTLYSTIFQPSRKCNLSCCSDPKKKVIFLEIYPDFQNNLWKVILYFFLKNKTFFDFVINH